MSNKTVGYPQSFSSLLPGAGKAEKLQGVKLPLSLSSGCSPCCSQTSLEQPGGGEGSCSLRSACQCSQLLSSCESWSHVTMRELQLSVFFKSMFLALVVVQKILKYESQKAPNPKANKRNSKYIIFTNLMNFKLTSSYFGSA